MVQFFKGVTMLDWHRKYYLVMQKKLGIHGYGMSWIAFIKGVLVGILIMMLVSCSIMIS